MMTDRENWYDPEWLPEGLGEEISSEQLKDEERQAEATLHGYGLGVESAFGHVSHLIAEGASLDEISSFLQAELEKWEVRNSS